MMELFRNVNLMYSKQVTEPMNVLASGQFVLNVKVIISKSKLRAMPPKHNWFVRHDAQLD